MAGQQAGGAGQSGPSQEQESTQVGMPVAPATPGYVQQPPVGRPAFSQPAGYPSQPPAYPPPAGYGPPQQPGYSAPPAGYGPPGYGYGPQPAKRGGPPMWLVAGFALLVVLAVGVGAMYFAHIGPFAVSASPTPTLVAGASATPGGTVATATPGQSTASPGEPTEPPSASPTPTEPGVTATAPSGDALSTLLGHVPTDLRDSCNSSDPTGNELATVTCNTSDLSIFVTYTSYPDQASMQSAYDGDKLAFGSGAGSNSCSSADNWPAEYGYSISGTHAGRLLCASLIGIPQLYWTDERFNILSFAISVFGETPEQMYTFWQNDSGPY
jgi:hypothetical protein